MLTKQIPITQCATCHNGGSRAAMSFRETFTYDQDLLHGHAYTQQPADYRWDRIVDEEGRPLQTTTVDRARPLNREEMERIRRAPYKRPGEAMR